MKLVILRICRFIFMFVSIVILKTSKKPERIKKKLRISEKSLAVDSPIAQLVRALH